MKRLAILFVVLVAAGWFWVTFEDKNSIPVVEQPVVKIEKQTSRVTISDIQKSFPNPDVQVVAKPKRDGQEILSEVTAKLQPIRDARAREEKLAQLNKRLAKKPLPRPVAMVQTEDNCEPEVQIEAVEEVPVVVEPRVPDRDIDVKVYVYEWEVDMSQLQIPSGRVHFEVLNSGKLSHDFSISSIGSLGRVKPGETRSFSVELFPGDYMVFSNMKQDKNRVFEDFTVLSDKEILEEVELLEQDLGF